MQRVIFSCIILVMNKTLCLLWLMLPLQGMINRPFACFYLRIHKIKASDHCYTYIPSVQESFAVSFALVSCPMAYDKRVLAKKLVKGLTLEINLADDVSARAEKSKRIDRPKSVGIYALHKLVQKIAFAPADETAAVFWKEFFRELDEWILAER